ncbi:MAG: 16S rRNA (guanine(527)-N(7))-methyltransferase RsmG [Gammaproteobacteria bacterium]|nr:16S rRNA (guanine(527)-N(7))-methyltransferase RsmG [Gammaproteobacteria bacterium]
MNLEKSLRQGLRDMNLDLPPPVPEKLLNFLKLLEKWNKTYNLTAVRDPEMMVPRHLLDSLSVLPFLHGTRVLDIGTGAGLPGIPLALARPDLDFTLLAGNAKKTRFATQALHALGLKNTHVVHERVEKFHPPKKFDTLIARAFASIPDMLAASRHLCAPDGRFLVMKGVFPQEELAAVTNGYRAEVKALTIPGLDAARHIVILAPVN